MSFTLYPSRKKKTKTTNQSNSFEPQCSLAVTWGRQLLNIGINSFMPLSYFDLPSSSEMILLWLQRVVQKILQSKTPKLNSCPLLALATLQSVILIELASLGLSPMPRHDAAGSWCCLNQGKRVRIAKIIAETMPSFPKTHSSGSPALLSPQGLLFCGNPSATDA